VFAVLTVPDELLSYFQHVCILVKCTCVEMIVWFPFSFAPWKAFTFKVLDILLCECTFMVRVTYLKEIFFVIRTFLFEPN